MNQQSQQNAYNMGAKMMQGQMAYNKGIQDLCNADYDEAWEHFAEAVNCNNPAGNEGLGLMCEMGIGVKRDTELADDFYKDGARAGNYACKMAINRIENSGHYSSSDKSTFLTNLRKMQGSGNAQFNGGGNIGGYSGGSNSSGGSSRTCAGCHGTGRCTGCAGKGGYYVNSGLYTGSYSQTWTRCGSCNGSGSCGVCRGAGSIRY